MNVVASSFAVAECAIIPSDQPSLDRGEERRVLTFGDLLRSVLPAWARWSRWACLYKSKGLSCAPRDTAQKFRTHLFSSA